MATLANLVVRVALDDQFSGKLDGIAGSVQAWGAKMTRVGKIATVGLTLPIVAGFGKMVMAASDMNETINVLDNVFGKSSKTIQKWAQTGARNFGLSASDANRAAGLFGALGKASGLAGNDLIDFSESIVQAAGDLGSFYNVEPTQVLQDLQSGLAGESEPLRKYNIYLTETAVAQKAMEMTGKANAKQLTEGEKVLARQALIMEQLGDAAGDFKNSWGGSLANQLRTLRTTIANVAATMGKILLPYAQKLVSWAQKAADALGKLSPHWQKLIVGFAAAVAAVGPVLTVLGYLTVAFGALLSPIGLVVAALVLVATKTDLLQRAFRFVADAIGPFVAAMKAAFDSGTEISKLVEFLPPGLQGLERGFLLIADAVGDLVAAWKSGGFSGLLDALPGELSQALDGVLSLVAGFGRIAVGFVLDTAVTIAGWLWDHKGDIWGGIKAAVGWTEDVFTQAVTATIDGAIELAGDLADAAGDVWGWVTGKLLGGDGGASTTGADVATGAGTIPLGTALLDGALELGGALLGIAGDFGGWLWPKLKGAWDGALDLGSALLDGAIDLGETLLGIAADFGTWLQNTVEGDWDGTLDMLGAILNGAIDLGQDLLDIAADFGGWLWGKVKGTWDGIIHLGTVFLDAVLGIYVDKIIGAFASVGAWLMDQLSIATDTLALPLGTVFIDATLALKDTVTFDDVATAIGDGVVAAVAGLPDLGAKVGGAIVDQFMAIDWDTIVTIDAEKLGKAIGTAVHDAIAAAVDIHVKAAEALLNMDWSDAPKNIGLGIAAAFVGAETAIGYVETALISFLKGSIEGLAFGDGDADWSSVINSIATTLMNALGVAKDAFVGVGSAIAHAIYDAIKDEIVKLAPGNPVDWLLGDGLTNTSIGKSAVGAIQQAGAKTSGGGGASKGGLNQQMLGGAIDFSPLIKSATDAQNAVTNAFVGMRNNVQTLTTLTNNVATNQFVALRNNAVQIATDLNNQATNQFVALRNNALTLATGVNTAVTNQFVALRNNAAQLAGATSTAVVAAFVAMRGGVAGAMASVVATVTGSLSGLAGYAASAGNDIGNSLGSGIYYAMQSWAGLIASEAANLVTGAITAARIAAQAHSPSRKMMELGDDLVAGLLIPIRSGQRDVAGAMGNLLAFPGVGAFGGVSAGGGTTVTIAPGAIVVYGAPGQSEEAIADAVFTRFSREAGLRSAS